MLLSFYLQISRRHRVGKIKTSDLSFTFWHPQCCMRISASTFQVLVTKTLTVKLSEEAYDFWPSQLVRNWELHICTVFGWVVRRSRRKGDVYTYIISMGMR